MGVFPHPGSAAVTAGVPGGRWVFGGGGGDAGRWAGSGPARVFGLFRSPAAKPGGAGRVRSADAGLRGARQPQARLVSLGIQGREKIQPGFQNASVNRFAFNNSSAVKSASEFFVRSV